ncbi:hypothetical protein KVT40_005236 [Elsinoe batatas]|uniref:Uncharacterized protein n=1 Tax=Elsinoe batatas TaxID=2601811 RepID=A0A8K0KY46_9PEZI|nr:hypothetical protein KVT40_005236 [Elsinoe batatas]
MQTTESVSPHGLESLEKILTRRVYERKCVLTFLKLVLLQRNTSRIASHCHSSTMASNNTSDPPPQYTRIATPGEKVQIAQAQTGVTEVHAHGINGGSTAAESSSQAVKDWPFRFVDDNHSSVYGPKGLFCSYPGMPDPDTRPSYECLRIILAAVHLSGSQWHLNLLAEERQVTRPLWHSSPWSTVGHMSVHPRMIDNSLFMHSRFLLWGDLSELFDKVSSPETDKILRAMCYHSRTLKRHTGKSASDHWSMHNFMLAADRFGSFKILSPSEFDTPPRETAYCSYCSSAVGVRFSRVTASMYVLEQHVYQDLGALSSFSDPTWARIAMKDRTRMVRMPKGVGRHTLYQMYMDKIHDKPVPKGLRPMRKTSDILQAVLLAKPSITQRLRTSCLTVLRDDIGAAFACGAIRRKANDDVETDDLPADQEGSQNGVLAKRD